ncbi:uncharacterized protein LOC123564163 isoform X1 [Mercenaria mercenaria]|uniref:uncharacterized protein LOC123564163 isoform X1 n=1 Tax=Mercenaria mercenaria TaxID=6596 RepID=UPI00234E5BD6|nr:uncharacterized protein LOC123564163 isoform X1 [Mercenaria mercenaria]
MTAKIVLFCVLLLESITGAQAYSYNVGGMVAASLAAFIFLIAIILLILVAVQWRDWYMRRQARRGRYRIPREKWRLFRYKVMKSTSREESPRSGMEMNMRMHNITNMPGSRTTTLERQQPITDAWVTRLPPVDHYEEKSKTLKFDPEEENVIVTDVLPDTTQRTVQPVVMTTAGPTTQTVTYQDSYQPYKDDSTTATHIRQTARARSERVSYEPYHVRLQVSEASQQPAHHLSQTTHPAQQYSQSTRPAQQLSQTMPSRGDGKDIFIQPHVPASNTPDIQAGVVVFDSDDEAGNIPVTRQSEDVVLF